MHRFLTRVFDLRLVAIAAALTLCVAPAAHSAVVVYGCQLDGYSESPVNASPGIGSAEVDIDAGAHTMRVQVSFVGLTGTTSASHIHAATTLPGAGTAGVATTTPTFFGFPLGVTAGAYDNTLNLTLPGSYNPAYVTANGGTAASAEAALLTAIAAGKAYLNVHSSTFPGGEIRGFLVPVNPTPATPTSWGRVKTLYR
jgi:hypothetical protein